MTAKKDCLDYIKSNTLIGIKAGAQRTHFLEIWMVVVDNRIFARSWGLAEKSWYNIFLLNDHGFIKCANDIYKVKARVPENTTELGEKINKAYLDKYNNGENAFYANGIIQEKHMGKTMEFILL